MTTTQLYQSGKMPESERKQQIVDFLFSELEAYGDPRKDIEKAVDYALNDRPGGFILTATDEQHRLTGVTVVNSTGMQGYIPENILVYIATHRNCRGQGIGRRLMEEALNHAEGDMALHVEPDNPARQLYASLGFTNKYLEMRFKKKG